MRRLVIFLAVSIPSLTDKNHIRATLNRDRVWGLYALGDLAEPMFMHTQWFAPDLTLVLRVHGTCILYAMGPGACVKRSSMWSGPHLQSGKTCFTARTPDHRHEADVRMGRTGTPRQRRPSPGLMP